MKLALNRLMALALLMSAGCASVPRGTPVAGDISARVIERFESRQPSSFEAIHTVLIAIKPHWWWPTVHQITLGCSRIDRATRSYDVTCLSPLGMKIFNISCTNGTVSGTLLLPMKDKHEAMVQSIGTAISSAYLDMTPAPGAPARRDGDDLIVSQSTGKLRTDYTFSETNAVLTSKEYFDDREKIMTITYGDYRPTTTNRLFPGRMSLQDHRNGYTLLFLLKEFN